MSLRESFTIAFSPRLFRSSPFDKREALVKLLEYIEESRDIPDVSEKGDHILDIVFKLIVELLETGEGPKIDDLTITKLPLTKTDQKTLRAAGFDVYQRLMSDRSVYVAA